MLVNKKNKYLIILVIGILVLYLLSNIAYQYFYTIKENFTDEDPIIIMKKYNVIFSGTARNVEPYIKRSLENIDICGKKFNDYALIIYENDSNDNTRNILKEHKKPNYHYIFEDNIKEYMKQLNSDKKKLDKTPYYDYLIMLDMDDVNNTGKFIKTIDSCFKYEKWDVLTGNQSNRYYDLWALRKKDDMEYDCWLKVTQNKNDPNAQHKYVDSKFKKYDPGQLLEVDSAFGAIAIYKISSIPLNCKYVGMHESGEDKCEHVEFNECIKNSGKNIYINTSFLTN